MMAFWEDSLVQRLQDPRALTILRDGEQWALETGEVGYLLTPEQHREVVALLEEVQGKSFVTLQGGTVLKVTGFSQPREPEVTSAVLSPYRVGTHEWQSALPVRPWMEVASVLAEGLQTDVALWGFDHYADPRPVPPDRLDPLRFNLLIGTGVLPLYDRHALYRIDGIRLGYPIECYAFSHYGLPIRDREDQRILEWLPEKRALYFLPCAVSLHQGPPVLRQLLQEFVKNLQTLGPAYADQLRASLEQEMEKDRLRFADRHQKWLRSQDSEFDAERERLREVVEYHGARFRDAVSDLVLYEKEHLARAEQREWDPIELVQALEKYPEVDRVFFDGDNIRVFTHRITCKDPRDGLIYDLGKFLIQLSTDPEGDRPQIFNLTHQVLGGDGYPMQAPHVPFSGVPCEGGFRSKIDRCMASRNYEYLFVECLQLLQTVNILDVWGEKIVNWPTVGRGEPEHEEYRPSEY